MTPEERARFCASLFLDPAKVSSEKRARVEREIAVSIREAVKAEREACAKLAATFAPTEPSPIGPLHGAGMSTAAIHIANAIRERPL